MCSIRRPAGLRMRTSPFESDDQQAGGQALDDFAAEPLGGLGAGRGGALLRLQLLDGLLQRRRQQRGLARAVAEVAPRVAGAPRTRRSTAKVRAAPSAPTIAVSPSRA